MSHLYFVEDTVTPNEQYARLRAKTKMGRTHVIKTIRLREKDKTRIRK